MKLPSRAELSPAQIKDMKVWAATVIVSLIIILSLSSVICRGLDIFSMDGSYCVKARVTELGEYISDDYELGGEETDITYNNSIQLFNARILNGELKGQTVLAGQTFDNYTNMNVDDPVKPGDKVVLYNYGNEQGGTAWVFGGYARLDGIIALGIAFVALLLFFGRMKGLNTVVSLALTCMAVFMVFVPSVLAGWNIYLMSSLTCVFVIVMTLFITNGISAKSLTTILGCAFGVLVAALLSIIFDRLLRITGMIDEHSIYLRYLGSGTGIDLNALIFGMIIIGAMGAVMDVAMDISSSLYEVHLHARQISFRELYASGMRIGRDIMGTMANTLVLAYIGSQLCATLLYVVYSSSLYELLNRESIVVEMMQALIGSLSILLTIPLTTLVCCFLYTGKGEELGVIRDRSKRLTRPVRVTESVRVSTQEVKPEEKPAARMRTLIPDKEPVDFYRKKDGPSDK
ncbi:MAG: YibE/F family protein [Firmicutes bacterium]|nr:YibE/F family protein [Bacillota bacterium]MBQ2058505.1 YibE/F family protein [Bacillota bacterium]MBQ4371190.1 YibE/F family protein [Bacillota bacterium]